MNKAALVAISFALMSFSQAKAELLSPSLQAISDLCLSNTRCKSDQRDNELLVRLQGNGPDLKFVCQQDGKCFRLFPKGRKMSEPNLVDYVSAK